MLLVWAMQMKWSCEGHVGARPMLSNPVENALVAFLVMPPLRPGWTCSASWLGPSSPDGPPVLWIARKYNSNKPISFCLTDWNYIFFKEKHWGFLSPILICQFQSWSNQDTPPPWYKPPAHPGRTQKAQKTRYPQHSTWPGHPPRVEENHCHLEQE